MVHIRVQEILMLALCSLVIGCGQEPARANDKMESVRHFAEANIAFAKACLLDLDGDGLGEFGSAAMVCGAAEASSILWHRGEVVNVSHGFVEAVHSSQIQVIPYPSNRMKNSNSIDALRSKLIKEVQQEKLESVSAEDNAIINGLERRVIIAHEIEGSISGYILIDRPDPNEFVVGEYTTYSGSRDELLMSLMQ